MLTYRKPTIGDMELYFHWANDSDVRRQSYQSVLIELEKHRVWFESVLKNENYFMLVFQNLSKENVGQVRILRQNDTALIGISVDSAHRGNGYAVEMLKKTVDAFFKLHHNVFVSAYIKIDNIGSKMSFEKAGFQLMGILIYEGFESFHYLKFDNEDR